MPEETTSTTDDSGVSASTKRLAGLARGYTFQDVVAGACILSVFFEESNAVSIESKLDEDDKFDDIILEKDGEKICLQLKNGPEHRLISSDLTGSNGRGLHLDNLAESREVRIESGEGSRFIVLTSFKDETGSGIEFSDWSRTISFLGDIEFTTRELIEVSNEPVEDQGIEFALGVPGIGTTANEEVESLRNTNLFEQVVENVVPCLNRRESPVIDDPYSLTERAVNLARWARSQPVDIQKLERGEIIRRLELSPSKKLDQEFDLPEGYIRPRWVEDLEDVYSSPDDRVLVEGRPGSGKSVGIELLHRSWEDSNDHRTLRFYLYIPDDADSLEKKRSDPEWFRHQLAAQIYSTFPEAFDNDSTAPVWTGREDLQRYITQVGQWAEEQDQRVLFIIDGLDHALRQFGGTSATESAEGTVLEEIGSLDFPDPLGLLMVSREITGVHDILRVDNQIEVAHWTTEEIEEFLVRKNISVTEGLVEQIAEVSGGLPVIIVHLIGKAETQEGNGEEVLQSTINEASHVDGDLEEYYSTIWEPLEPFERDAVSLVALNPTGLRDETIRSAIDLPYVQEKIRLEQSPLAHILDPTSDGRFRVFHDSFRKFTEDQLDQEEIKQGHRRLYNYFFDRCLQFPQSLDSLKFHAENGPGHTDLKDLATLENLLHWWQEGIYLDHLSNTLELAFESSLRDGDYFTAVDCMMLGGVARNMLDIYMEDNSRLRYFAAQNDRERALRLLDQIQGYDGGSEEAIEAMQIVAQNWETELDREWLIDWENDHQAAEQPSWDPEAFFEVASVALDPDNFWEAAAQIKREDTGHHFSREVLAAVQKKPALFDSQSEPPEWLFEDEQKALEACEDLIHDLPGPWREELRQHAPEYSELSLAALHTLLRCGGTEEHIQEIVEYQELDDPVKGWSQNTVSFYDAYYTGSILAGIGKSPDELLATVDEIAVEQTRAQKILAMMGAAATSRSSNETGHWVNNTLTLLRESFEQGFILDYTAQQVDQRRYWDALSSVSEEFREVAVEGSDDLINEILELSEDMASQDRCLTTITDSLRRTWEDMHPDKVFPENIDQRYREIMTRPPDEEPPSRDLIDLAFQAASEGYSSRARAYAETAVECCFRYGYRKDRFLDDVWQGFEDIVEEDWNRHLGTAIQLVNWAGLLHELTDGKETHHFEGEFLTSLLDADAVNYHTAEEHARNNTTVRKLWSWRLENPAGLTEDELDSMIYLKESKIRSSHHSKRALPFFTKAAMVAEDFGWTELTVKALQALNRGEYVRNGISPEREQSLRDLASEHDVEIPDDLESDNSSDGFETEVDEDDSNDNPVRELLSQHSTEDPLSTDDLAELSSEQISTANELLQYNGIDSARYNPTAAAPLSRVLAERGEKEEAVALLENVIAERDLMNSWLGGGRERFQVVAQALLDIDESQALQSVLNGWIKSRLDTQSYQAIAPQLLWIVKRSEGEMAAEELFSHIVGWMRRMMYPYEDWTQKWGVLESSNP